MKEGELDDVQVLKDKIIPLLNTYVSFFDLNRKFNFKGYNMFDKSLQGAYPANYKGLFKDRNFENSLSLRALYTNVAVLETNELINEAEGIINMINQYLGKEQ
jgi:hypothetical protein